VLYSIKFQVVVELDDSDLTSQEVEDKKCTTVAPVILYNIGKIRSLLGQILGYDNSVTIHDIKAVINDDQQTQAEFDVIVSSMNLSQQQLYNFVTSALDVGGDTWMEGDITANGFVAYDDKVYLSLYDYYYNVELVNISIINQSPMTSVLKLDNDISLQRQTSIDVSKPLLLVLDYRNQDWVFVSDDDKIMFPVKQFATYPFTNDIVNLMTTCDIYQISSMYSNVKIMLKIKHPNKININIQTWFGQQLLLLPPNSIHIYQPLNINYDDWTNCLC